MEGAAELYPGLGTASSLTGSLYFNIFFGKEDGYLEIIIIIIIIIVIILFVLLSQLKSIQIYLVQEGKIKCAHFAGICLFCFPATEKVARAQNI